MTITRKLTAITTAIALAATTLGSVTTSASAHDWRDGNGGGRQYARNYDGGRDGGRDFRRSDDRDWGRHEGRNRYYARHRHHDNTGKYIALGVGALMLGILASEAGRHR